jgi:hypothetical protein
MNIPGVIEATARSVFTTEQLENLELKSNIGDYELLLRIKIDGKPDDAVGIQIPISMFHQTEDFHKDWRNVMRNLLELYNLKLTATNLKLGKS